MIEPIRYAKNSPAMPSAQVPRFQTIAAISSEKTMAYPGAAADLQNQLDRQQRNDTVNATAPVDVSTPIRFQVPDQTTA